ncbi:MAG: DUF5658 family protein [Candidatus Babeliales bacterium]
MPVLIILMLTDFVLTYISVTAQYAYEANSLMAWLFNLPFGWSLLARLVMMAVILIPFWLIFRKKDRYKRLLRMALIGEGIIVLSHSWWIIEMVRAL